MDLQKIEDGLREYFARQNKTLPERFPCPRSQRVQTAQDLKRYIDHTLLRQTATSADYEKLFAEAREWQPFSVCVPPVRIPAAVRALRGSGVKVCAVVGFPWGYESSPAKAADVAYALSQGCDEIDMVLSVGMLKEGEYLSVFDDIQSVVEAADGRLVKVILESAELLGQDIAAGSFIAGWAGAWFVKTSTGFASAGASLEALQIMRVVAGDTMGVKASGGIHNRAFAEALIEAGADRLGVSATGVILGHNKARSSSY